jgi:NAD(P)-dependent dehydrogenase (short-subunit alcohol dehydrogenase family)
MTERPGFTLKPGLRVLVTAAAAGIGREIAERLATAGARVHICDIDASALEACQKAHPDWGISRCDVAEEAEVDRLFDEVRAHLGGLDALVNNAGIAGPTAEIGDIAPADWRRTIDINLNSHFYCTRLALPMLKQAGDGIVVNISSVAGRLGYAYRTPYAATKWAIVGMTQSLAKEQGPAGIRVNAILPGVTEGPRIEKVIAARAETVGVSYEEMEKYYVDKVSLRRMVTAGDIANMALFLCSAEGRNISGQALSVCGNVETI